jgi:hypothetical protein
LKPVFNVLEIVRIDILIAKEKACPLIRDEPQKLKLLGCPIRRQHNRCGLVYKHMIPPKIIIHRPFIELAVHPTCNENKGTIENAIQSGTIPENAGFVDDERLKGGMGCNLTSPVVKQMRGDDDNMRRRTIHMPDNLMTRKDAIGLCMQISPHRKWMMGRKSERLFYLGLQGDIL